MKENTKESIKLILAYSDILIILYSLNLLFKLCELIWKNYNNISLDFLNAVLFLIPFSYFLYKIYNNNKLNKTKANNFIFALVFIYIIGNFFIQKIEPQRKYVSITSNISDETESLTYGDGQEHDVYVNSFKEEGLFDTSKKNFYSSFNELENNNEIMILQNFNFYQTGIILGNDPINFKPKEYNGLIDLIEKNFVYSFNFFIDLIILSFKNFIFSFLILTFYQVYKQKKAKKNLLSPIYYTNLFE